MVILCEFIFLGDLSLQFLYCSSWKGCNNDNNTSIGARAVVSSRRLKIEFFCCTHTHVHTGQKYPHCDIVHSWSIRLAFILFCIEWCKRLLRIWKTIFTTRLKLYYFDCPCSIMFIQETEAYVINGRSLSSKWILKHIKGSLSTTYRFLPHSFMRIE